MRGPGIFSFLHFFWSFILFVYFFLVSTAQVSSAFRERYLVSSMLNSQCGWCHCPGTNCGVTFICDLPRKKQNGFLKLKPLL